MIYRIDVRTTPTARGGLAAVDPLGEAVRHQIQEFGITVGPITVSRIFLIDSDSDPGDIERAAQELLADPIVESAHLVAYSYDDSGRSRIEIHLKPGVMDPVAASTEMALRDMGLKVREVRTGRAFVIEGNVPRQQLEHIAGRVLANGVIESVHFDAYVPRQFQTGRPYTLELRHVKLLQLSDEQLTKLSRDAHLFLSLAEMKAIQSYFQQQGRDPSDIELETIAQTWSEHCVHKTLKSAVDVEVRDESGNAVGQRHYGNLIKETIFSSTMQLMDKKQKSGEGEFCLSVFADNAGVVAFDDVDAVCFKVETHNHPSAIEPYGGSATGAGGVIRDILGTGLAAKPIANTDVFCVAYPDRNAPGAAALPRGVIHPRRILQQVVAGVRDYGNRMGIPTINGAVYFDERYLGNPLVFCGCIGLIPRDKINKAARAGDAIVVMGGRTGRDGIHGATFSSAELTDTHADEFSHAVQIGNAITEKKVADVILQARDRNLFTGITDCGAGGLSSAVGEMGEKIGATVQLDQVPLKYAGLRYDEIWISEAQERMVLSVRPQKLEELLALSKSEDVESTVVGEFGTADQALVLRYSDKEVGRLSMDFLHHGIPMPRRSAVVTERTPRATGTTTTVPPGRSLKETLLVTLGHPNIASKHWIIRQYDHEVQGGSAIKPLVGPRQVGPSDASVIRPKLGTHRGVVVGCGLTPQIKDPYDMALAAIDEAIRNVVAVGADPSRLAILDNFCWPSVDDPITMGTLVRACEACRDAALAYGVPFISGKDSLHNQFTDSENNRVIRIPNTLLISAIGVIDDVRKCRTMDLKKAGNAVIAVYLHDRSGGLGRMPGVHRAVSRAIAEGLVESCHDCSDGGVAVAAAEMCIASGLGMMVQGLPWGFFDEMPGSTYLIECQPETVDALAGTARAEDCRILRCGNVTGDGRLQLLPAAGPGEAIDIDEMTRAWRGTLDW